MQYMWLISIFWHIIYIYMQRKRERERCILSVCVSEIYIHKIIHHPQFISWYIMIYVIYISIIYIYMSNLYIWYMYSKIDIGPFPAPGMLAISSRSVKARTDLGPSLAGGTGGTGWTHCELLLKIMKAQWNPTETGETLGRPAAWQILTTGAWPPAWQAGGPMNRRFARTEHLREP